MDKLYYKTLASAYQRRAKDLEEQVAIQKETFTWIAKQLKKGNVEGARLVALIASLI